MGMWSWHPSGNFADQSRHEITRQARTQRRNQRIAGRLRYVEVVRTDHRIGQVQVIRQHVVVEQPLRQLIEHVDVVVDAAPAARSDSAA